MQVDLPLGGVKGVETTFGPSSNASVLELTQVWCDDDAYDVRPSCGVVVLPRKWEVGASSAILAVLGGTARTSGLNCLIPSLLKTPVVNMGYIRCLWKVNDRANGGIFRMST